MNRRVVQQGLTKWFVQVDPRTVRMTGSTKIDLPDGGVRTVTDKPRRPIVVTLVEPSNSGYQTPIVTTQGSQDTLDYQLVAEWGTDVREGDVFEADGHTYRVVTLMPDNGYETRALVERRDG